MSILGNCNCCFVLIVFGVGRVGKIILEETFVMFVGKFLNADNVDSLQI